MSESSRVQQWRNRMRGEGKVPMTIWLDTQTKRHLEALARTQRCAPSDIVHQALAAYQPEASAATVSLTDTSLLRQLIQEALAQLPDRAPISAFATETAQLRQLIQAEVTTHQEQFVSTVIDRGLALITPGLPKLVEETIRAMSIQARGADVPSMPHTNTVTHGPDTVTDTITDIVTDTITETDADTYADTATDTATDTTTEPSSQPRAYGDVPAGVLAALAQRANATPAELAKALGDGTKDGTKRVWQALQRLRKSGKVIQEGKRYRLPA